jgi:enoyl-CoA hydratase/carnithine racemase
MQSRRSIVINDTDLSPMGSDRRGLIAAGAAVALAAGLVEPARSQTAQRSYPPPLSPQAKPGRVVVERRGAVLLMGIDRVEAQNRLDSPILIGLGKAYYQLEHDDGLRVGVLHGLGPDFSFGLDAPAFLAGITAGLFPPKDPDYMSPYGTKVPFRTKPVVVAVQGATWFGGHELFLAADIRVAASDTNFNQGEVTRGVFPTGGATVRFVREAGWANAMRYMLTGEQWGAEEGRRLGLVQDITAPGKQLDRAIELAQKIATVAAPLGVRATMASAHQSLAGEEPAFATLLPEFVRLLQSEDFKEFGRAGQEGRAPVFQGK